MCEVVSSVLSKPKPCLRTPCCSPGCVEPECYDVSPAPLTPLLECAPPPAAPTPSRHHGASQTWRQPRHRQALCERYIDRRIKVQTGYGRSVSFRISSQGCVAGPCTGALPDVKASRKNRGISTGPFLGDQRPRRSPVSCSVDLCTNLRSARTNQ